MIDPPPPKPLARYLLLSGVGAELSVSNAQVYALVRSGDLPAIKVGGRGQWRVERSVLEEYIARAYRETPNGSVIIRSEAMSYRMMVPNRTPRRRSSGRRGLDGSSER